MSGEIYAALAAVMRDVGAVGKTRKNQGQGYQFRGVDDVVAHVVGVMAQHGVVCVPRVVEREREVFKTAKGSDMFSVRLVVEHTFYARDGSSVVCTTLGEAMDSGDKASNKAMSAALKYALTETLLIPTYEVDRDTEEHSPEVTGPATKSPPKPTPPQADAGLALQVRASTVDVWTKRMESAGTVVQLNAILADLAKAVQDAAIRGELRPVAERRMAALKAGGK